VQPAITDKATCMVVNGGCVKVDVPDKAAINPASFTIEAWVRVDWTSDDTNAWRTVLDSRDVSPAGTGFGLHARTDDNTPGVYHWEAVVGNGGMGTDKFTSLTSPDAITLTVPDTQQQNPVYLAVTYDAASQILILFVDGQEVIKISTPYVPNTTQPLLIGAAGAFLPQRPQAPGVLAGPLFPWVGAIQDVAIYNVALDGGVIVTHFDQGQGHKT
jgi:hypothetical protein